MFHLPTLYLLFTTLSLSTFNPSFPPFSLSIPMSFQRLFACHVVYALKIHTIFFVDCFIQSFNKDFFCFKGAFLICRPPSPPSSHVKIGPGSLFLLYMFIVKINSPCLIRICPNSNNYIKITEYRVATDGNHEIS